MAPSHSCEAERQPEFIMVIVLQRFGIYRAESAVLAIVNPSVRLSVRPSHVGTVSNNYSYGLAVFTGG